MRRMCRACVSCSAKRTEIYWGVNGATNISTAHEVDVVLAAIVGAGLVPTLQAIQVGKEVALQ